MTRPGAGPLPCAGVGGAAPGALVGTAHGAKPPGVRRAFVLASAERYLSVALTFSVIAVASRLLTPEEVGLAVLGTSLLGVADCLRDFGVSAYLVQQKAVSRERVRAAFTILLLMSGLVAAVLVAASGWIAGFYGKPGLADFLRTMAVVFVLTPFAAPGLALLRRDMAFGALAFINVASAAAGAATTVGLVVFGAGYMSFAWGAVAWAAASAALALRARPGFWMFRLSLRGWREALAFGGYNGATTVLNKLYEALPYLALGRLLPIDAVALYNRAAMLCQMPDKVALPGVASVALPALAAAAREGRDLKKAYLRALAYITVVQWPALALIAFLAHPIVALLLGEQWLAAVPLVRIVAVASMALFPAALTYPVLVAVGAVRDALVASLVSLPISAAVLVGAAFLGLEAVALSLFVTAPLQAFVALYFVRRHAAFRWRELGCALWRSGLVALCCAAGTAVAVLLAGWRLDMPFGHALLAAAGGAVGWFSGVALVSHPFLGEIGRAAGALRRAPMVARAIALVPRPAMRGGV